MKNLFKILPFFMFVALISSCEDNEGAVHHEDVNKFSLLSFDQSAYRLNVIIDSTGTLVIPFRASSLSSVDRTYVIELLEERSTANPLTYDLPSTVTIPANQYSGNIVITGQDLDLVDLTPRPFVFQVTGLNEVEFIDNDVITVNVVEVCPLYSDFTGNYVVTPITSGLAGVPFAAGSVVSVTQVSEFEREFEAVFLPGWAAPTVVFKFTLSCGNVVVADYDTRVYCGEAGSPTVKILSGNVYGTYDSENDSEIIISYREDYGGCSASTPIQVTFKLTKQ